MRSALTGDRDTAALYLGYARAYLQDLKNLMRLGGLQQLQRTYSFPDGTVMKVSVVFGQDYVAINSPVQQPVEAQQETTQTEYDAEAILADIALTFGDTAYARGSGQVTLTQPQPALVVPAETISIRSRVAVDVLSGYHELYYKSDLGAEFQLSRPLVLVAHKQYASGSATVFRATLIYPMVDASLVSMAVAAEEVYATFESRTAVAASGTYPGYEHSCRINFQWSGFHARTASGLKTIHYPSSVVYGIGPDTSGASSAEVARYNSLASAWASIGWRTTVTLPAEAPVAQPDKTVTFTFSG